MSERIMVQAFDGVPGEALADVRARISVVTRGTNALVEALRVKLTRAGAGTLLAQVNAEIDGRRVRVQEATAGVGDALDRLTEALHERILAVTGSWTPRPWPGPTGFRRPPKPPSGAPLPQIARVKSPALVWCAPDAAARTMDAMDYDIHLFTDPATESDAVVYRVGPTGYRLARTTAAGPPRRRGVPMTLSPHSAPRLTDAQAVDRLRAAELPFLFFANPGSGRGRVLYQRFDGRLGLIAGTS